MPWPTPTGLVTDAGSVKTPLLDLMADPRYVGGHPMAGSEQEGVAGARSDLFEGRTWVLTPVAGTDDDAFAAVRSVVAGFGAEVVSLPPDRHDSMVAVVSHVPHLTAASLMGLADERAEEHRGLLRLAAGRVPGHDPHRRRAPGHLARHLRREPRRPSWPSSIGWWPRCGRVRDIVDDGDRDGLVAVLERARSARLALPARFARPEDLAELRVPVRGPDGRAGRHHHAGQPSSTSASPTSRSPTPSRATRASLILLVEAALGERLRQGLADAGYRPVLRSLDAGEER